MPENGQSTRASQPSLLNFMNLIDDNAAYTALKSRDPRFDGIFYVGVTSTGIYCRPICPVRVPKRENCRFLKTPALRRRRPSAPACAAAQNSLRVMPRWIMRTGWLI